MKWLVKNRQINNTFKRVQFSIEWRLMRQLNVDEHFKRTNIVSIKTSSFACLFYIKTEYTRGTRILPFWYYFQYLVESRGAVSITFESCLWLVKWMQLMFTLGKCGKGDTEYWLLLITGCAGWSQVVQWRCSKKG